MRDHRRNDYWSRNPEPISHAQQVLARALRLGGGRIAGIVWSWTLAGRRKHPGSWVTLEPVKDDYTLQGAVMRDVNTIRCEMVHGLLFYFSMEKDSGKFMDRIDSIWDARQTGIPPRLPHFALTKLSNGSIQHRV